MKVSLIRPSSKQQNSVVSLKHIFEIMKITFSCVAAEPSWWYTDKVALSQTDLFAKEVSWSIDPTEPACTFLCAGQHLSAHVHSVFWVQFVRVQRQTGAVISPADCCILTPSPWGAWAHPKALEEGRAGNGKCWKWDSHIHAAPWRQEDWPGHSVTPGWSFSVCFSAGCWTVP